MYCQPGRRDIGPSTRGVQLTMVSADRAMRFWSVRASPSGDTIPRLKANKAGYSRTLSADQITAGIAAIATVRASGSGFRPTTLRQYLCRARHGAPGLGVQKGSAPDAVAFVLRVDEQREFRLIARQFQNDLGCEMSCDKL